MYWGDMLGGAATGAGIGSMFPGIGTAIGAGVGLVGGAMMGKEKEKAFQKQSELAARTAELSPWTGMKPQAPQQPLQSQSLIKGIGAGASMYGAGQKMRQQEKLSDMMKQQQIGTYGQPGMGWQGLRGQGQVPMSYQSRPGMYQG